VPCMERRAVDLSQCFEINSLDPGVGVSEEAD
jgi:hypothetical protein